MRRLKSTSPRSGRGVWTSEILYGALLFPGALADAYDARGRHCYDPASLLFLEVAAKVDGYPDYASFCDDLEQADKGRCYRDLAGLDEAIPGQDSFNHFRKCVGHSVQRCPASLENPNAIAAFRVVLLKHP
jgi:hypothetical protein